MFIIHDIIRSRKNLERTSCVNSVFFPRFSSESIRSNWTFVRNIVKLLMCWGRSIRKNHLENVLNDIVIIEIAYCAIPDKTFELRKTKNSLRKIDEIFVIEIPINCLCVSFSQIFFFLDWDEIYAGTFFCNASAFGEIGIFCMKN